MDRWGKSTTTGDETRKDARGPLPLANQSPSPALLEASFRKGKDLLM